MELTKCFRPVHNIWQWHHVKASLLRDLKRFVRIYRAERPVDHEPVLTNHECLFAS